MKQDVYRLISTNKNMTGIEGLSLNRKKKSIHYKGFAIETASSKNNFNGYDNFFFNLTKNDVALDKYGNPENLFDDMGMLSFTPAHMYSYDRKSKKEIRLIYNDLQKSSLSNTFYYDSEEELEKLLTYVFPKTLEITDKLIKG